MYNCVYIKYIYIYICACQPNYISYSLCFRYLPFALSLSLYLYRSIFYMLKTFFSCSFRKVICYSLHDLNLSWKASYIVSCLLQQAAHIHGFPTWHKLSKLVGLALISWWIILDDPFLHGSSSHHTVMPCPVSKLEENGSTPSPPWSNCVSHGWIRRDLYSLTAFADFFNGWWTGCILSHLQECTDEPPSKLDFVRIGV